jgi:hypothetical protein
MKTWETPSSYFGFNPVGDFVVYVRHRESNHLDNSNFETIKAHLEKVAAGLPEPDERADRDGFGWVYTWSATHFGYGWVEYLMIREDAPAALIEAGREVEKRLADYPVFDEDDWGDRQYKGIQDYWEGLGLREKIEYCVEAGLSCFAARGECTGQLFDLFFDKPDFS